MFVPIGTRVVTTSPQAARGQALPAGSLAVIVELPADPTHPYGVRLPDGQVTRLARGAFVLLREAQATPGAADPMADRGLQACVIYRCLVGSRAYGLENDNSDQDLRGVYLPPAARQWSLFGVPEQIENRATDEVYWELGKFLLLALKANPNVLEVLYSPIVLDAHPLGQELTAMRRSFVSKLVYQTYSGYVMSQFKRLHQRLERGLEPKWKHAMHLIRLLISGIEILRTGDVPVRVDDRDRPRLLSIRHGEESLDAVDAWQRELYGTFQREFERSTLPERPDYAAADALLIRARRFAVEDWP